jgi:hypothetical protein
MGSQSSTQKTITEPWAPVQPALKASIPEVEDVYQQRLGQQFYPGQTYAGFDPAQTKALGQVEDIATSGNGLTPAAIDYTRSVLHGDYLNAGNPYQAAVDKSVGDPVLAATTAQWSRAGRGVGNYGGSGVAADVGKGMTAALAPIHQQAYEAERARQEAAAGRAPALDQARYNDAGALYGVGQQRQAMDQQAIQEAMARDDFEKNKGAAALAEKENYLLGLGKMGGTQTTTTTSNPSALQMLAGVGMTAAGAMMGMPVGGSPFSSMSFLPWMTQQRTA